MSDTAVFALALAYGIGILMAVQPAPVAPPPPALTFPAWIPSQIDIPSVSFSPSIFYVPSTSPNDAPRMMIDEFRWPTTGLRRSYLAEPFGAAASSNRSPSAPAMPMA